MKIISVVYLELPLKELTPSHNPPGEHYNRVKQSILKEGLKNPLWINRRNNINHINAGNTRYAVWRDLGHTSIPCIVVNYEGSTKLKGTLVTCDNIGSFFGSKGIYKEEEDGFIKRAIGDWE